MLLLSDAAESLASPKKKKKRGGSRPGRSANLEREHAQGHERLNKDYFADVPVYTDFQFRRRFRMSRPLFERVLEGVLASDDYFRQRPDAVGRVGLSPYQKVTAVLRMMCYGISADTTDEYLRLGESTALESLYRFVNAVITAFGEEYLRQPTADDIKRRVNINARRGFPGMFGSIDCTHWAWKNCPMAWKCMFLDRKGNSSIIMEAVATRNLWIWHSYIGVAGSNNDINVIDRSPLIVNWLSGNAPHCSYRVNGKAYDMTISWATASILAGPCSSRPSPNQQTRRSRCSQNSKKP
jgi:hypothetical protein